LDEGTCSNRNPKSLDCVKGIALLGEHEFPLNAKVMNRETSTEVSHLLLGVTGRMTTGSSLYQAAKLIFSSWDKALIAAGLNPFEIRRSLQGLLTLRTSVNG
jgi:hypothetical protein